MWSYLVDDKQSTEDEPCSTNEDWIGVASGCGGSNNPLRGCLRFQVSPGFPCRLSEDQICWGRRRKYRPVPFIHVTSVA
jgi:hypothetical protein